MLPYNDVYVVMYYWYSDTHIVGVFSSKHLADMFIDKIVEDNQYKRNELGIEQYKLNSMEV